MKNTFKNIFQQAYRRLATGPIRNTLRLWLLLERKQDIKFPITNFSAASVLVLAPHMDDETIGCGGTIRKHILAGARVTVVYTTDGRRSNQRLYQQNLDAYTILKAENELVLQRKEEARKACAILGVVDLMFLDYPDGALQPGPEACERLQEIINETRPNIIYYPSLQDDHTDHWATDVILYRTLKLKFFSIGWDLTLRGYEVHTPLLANRWADITDTHDDKMKALEVFVSQNSLVDYTRATDGLSRYRSMRFFKGQGHAEAFYESSADAFGLLYEEITGVRRDATAQYNV